MLRNYFKTAVRNIYRHKLLYSINLFGLIIGITVSMVLVNYVLFETSFDKFHTQGENIYRVISEPFKDGAPLDKSVPIPYTHGAWLAERYPEILDCIRIRIPSGIAGLNSISYQDKKFSNDQVYFADDKFLKYFSFSLIKGNPKTALTEMFSVVLTESTAKKYFGNDDPIDKSLTVKSKKYTYSCKVTGIIKDLPKNSSMKFDALISFKTYMFQDDNRLLNDPMRHSFITYLVLAPGVNPEKLSEKYEPFLKERMPESYTKVLRFKFSLQPLTDIHLYSGYLYDPNQIGSWRLVYFFLIIALLVLPICIINYISFFGTQAVERAKELAMRQVLGGTKRQIFFQFITESFLINLIAFSIATTLAFTADGYFDQLTGQKTPLILFDNFRYVIGLTLIFTAVVIISGLYPALVLLSLKSFKILSSKSAFKHSKGAVKFRNVLTVFQFAVSLTYVISSIIIYLQIDFMKSQDLGFINDRVIVIKAPIGRDTITQLNREVFLKELRRSGKITNASQSNSIPGDGDFDADIFPQNNKAFLYILQVDQNFMETYDFQFLAGRNFSGDAQANKTLAIVNEAALKELKLKDASEAVGKKLLDYFTVIGVVNDHRHLYFTKDYIPFIYLYDPSRYVYLSIRYSGESEKEIISFIKSKWIQFFPESPYDYFFQEEFYNRQYKDDNSYAKIFGLSALLTIVLSCIGVFGLSYFDVTNRTKEIAIRRALGANLSHVIITLSKRAIILLVIANVVAWPVAYYTMISWLSNYSSRIGMPLWVYIVCSLGILILMLSTMSLQFAKVAKKNPVDFLGTE